MSKNYYAENRDRVRLVAKHRRRDNVAAAVVQDAQRADRKKGRLNDLDLPFVQNAVSQPCHYCGETGLRMTLDRIDNSVGHTQANVVPACERCNFARRDMPYEAWVIVAVAMRKAREQGAFGSWVGGIHRRHTLIPVPASTASLREPPTHGTLAYYFKCGPPRCEPCRHAMRDWKRSRREQLKLPA